MSNINFNNIDYSTRGFYTMALFTMYVNGRLSSTLSNMKNKDQGTFVHEYIHYMQNITTLSGLRFSSFYIEFIIRLIKWLKLQDIIKIPINAEDICSTKILKSDFIFFNSISGHLKSFDFDMEQDLMWNFDPNKQNRPIYFRIKTRQEQYEHILLGTHAIKESMAALYQSLIDKDSEATHNAYPYKVIPYIAKRLFPDIASDTRKMICICQIALNSPNPVDSLLKWLVFAYQNKEMTGLDLYNRHLDETFYAYGKDEKKLEKYTVKELLDQSSDDFSNKLRKILEGKENSYSNVVKNIKPFVDIHLRVLYSGNDLIDDFEVIFQVCGTPFIYNDYGERIHLSTKQHTFKNLPLDPDIQFILSLNTLCTSLLLPPNTCNSRCIFRTIYCNNQLNQDELSEHIYCFDEPWKERKCNYWKILNMLDIDSKKFIFRTY